MCEEKMGLSETPVIDGQQPTAPVGDKVFACLMPSGDGPPVGGYESLKEAAERMIKSGSVVGLNPHKVKRLCEEFKRLKAASEEQNHLGIEKLVCGDHWEGLSGVMVDGNQACPWCVIEELTAEVQEAEKLIESKELNGPTRTRIITSLSRLIADARHRFDDCKNNLDDGSKGGYGDDLKEAIELLDELKKGPSAESGDRHHDDSTLISAYEQGFEDAKKVILQTVQKLSKSI